MVRDLNPLAQAANYDMKQFFQGALDANTWQGKTYWMDYIGEPTCPLIAYNKTKIKAMGVQEPNDNWTFDDPLFRAIVLRGICWAAHQPANRLEHLAEIGARIVDSSSEVMQALNDSAATKR